ncbi:uncharacterized protein [Panulirus ornatus]
MGAMTFDDEPVTSPLCGEPALALGTIVEAKEGSTSGESETEAFPDPPEPPPASICSSSVLRREQTVEVSLGEEAASPPPPHPDVDGGWAWVVLLAMFLVFVINSGLLCTTSMYFVQMLVEFGKSRSYTAWMGSLMNAFFMLGGPISSVFIQRWGCRPSLMFGAVVMMVGYLASAFATSLEMLFVTYGVIVACGMNFAYSGQIIALAQYFEKRQSIATSIAMIGIGLGIFFLSSLTKYIIYEYGWRGSFIWSAGLGLQIAVLGALVFPLEPMSQTQTRTMSLQQTDDYPGSTITFKGIPVSKSRVIFEKSLNDRSFSSLRLSAGASYLSHSILSLHDAQANNRQDSHYDLSLRSNQHSFCSRGSHFAIGSLRSNGYSFCTRDSHAELSHFELHSNQFSFHNKDTHGESGLQSNTHSFCSRRDSQAGVSGIKSNPHSFCKTSQMDLHQHLHNHQHLEREAESLKGVGAGCGGGQARFLLREGDCDLSCCAEEDEEPSSSDRYTHTMHNERRSLCMLLIKKMKRRTQAFISRIARKFTGHPLLDPQFWLMDFSIFFAMLGTLCLQIIYKDFADSKGVGDYYSMALSAMGIGDLCGRISVGLLVSTEYVQPLFTYTLAMLLCCLVIVGHVFITTSTQLVALTTTFGYLYGGQNVLIAVTPSLLFGRDKLPTVFGHILFLGGIGALIGAPIAGSIADTTGDYDGVIWFSVASLSSGTFLMFMCYLLNCKKVRHQQEVNV